MISRFSKCDFWIPQKISDRHRGPDVKLGWAKLDLVIKNNLLSQISDFSPNDCCLLLCTSHWVCLQVGNCLSEKCLCFLVFFKYPTQVVATELIPPRHRKINPSASVSQFRLLYGTVPVAHCFCAANVTPPCFPVHPGGCPRAGGVQGRCRHARWGAGEVCLWTQQPIC